MHIMYMMYNVIRVMEKYFDYLLQWINRKNVHKLIKNHLSIHRLNILNNIRLSVLAMY